MSSELELPLQAIQETLQASVVPDLRELKVRMASMKDQERVYFEALRNQSDAQFEALAAALDQTKAEQTGISQCFEERISTPADCGDSVPAE